MNNEEPTIRPLSKEETTKTQILNLQEVKSTAKKETIASRTKLITTFLFVLGGLFVISGFLYTPIYNLLNKPDKKEKVTQTTNLRKTSGFDIADRIEITFTAPKEVKDALKQFKKYVMDEVLALKLEEKENKGEELKINDYTMIVSLKKVK